MCLCVHLQYTVRHWIGVALCIGGLVIQVMSNLSEASVADKNRMISGDIMTLCAALCFAVSNTGEEACIKKKDTVRERFVLPHPCTTLSFTRADRVPGRVWSVWLHHQPYPIRYPGAQRVEDGGVVRATSPAVYSLRL